MLRRLVALVLGAAAAAVCITGAAGNWQSKPFNTWTDLELKEVVTSSPWAGKAAVTYVKTPGVADPEYGGSNYGGPLRSGLVWWSSALPLRQAIERGKFQAGTAVSPDIEARLAAVPDTYVITFLYTSEPNFASQVALRSQVTVTSPPGFAQQTVLMYAETALRPANKPPIRPIHIDAQIIRDARTAVPSAGGWLFTFTFPKTDRLAVTDAKVEFTTKLCMGASDLIDLAGRPKPPRCDVNVKRTFMLKDMVYDGALAL